MGMMMMMMMMASSKKIVTVQEYAPCANDALSHSSA
jgi:hypothetical protein